MTGAMVSVANYCLAIVGGVALAITIFGSPEPPPPKPPKALGPTYTLPTSAPREIKFFDSFNRTLVMYGGACSGCSLTAIRFEDLPLGGYDRVVICYDGPPQEEVVQRARQFTNLKLMSGAEARPFAAYSPRWVG
ncbi:MAG: hypothetical protein C4320_01660 [Armatimonadota bacterium]